MSEVLERGNIYFFYRPRLGQEVVRGLEDIRRFYLILKPHGKDRYRLLIIGRKRLPEVADGRETYWGFVDKVRCRPEDIEATLDATDEEPAARPVGEGVYAIARHGDHTHLAYALELPEQPGEVQQSLRVEPQAIYVLSVKNPHRPSPREAGLDDERQASFPPELQAHFGNRRFIPTDPPDFLDYEGTELLFIGAAEDVSKELGLRLDPERETAESADVYTELRLERELHPVEPLLQGEWR